MADTNDSANAHHKGETLIHKWRVSFIKYFKRKIQARQIAWAAWVNTFFTLALVVVGCKGLGVYRSQVEQAKNALKVQFRAYVLYENGRVDVSKDGANYTVFLELKNSGQVPAYMVTNWFSAKAMDQLSDPYATFKIGSKETTPGGEFGFYDTGRESTDIGPEQSMCLTEQFPLSASNLTDGNMVIYVWGGTKFHDGFQRNQVEAFQLQSVGRIERNASLRLTMIEHNASNVDDLSDKPKPESFPWRESPNNPATQRQSAILQGPCRKPN